MGDPSSALGGALAAGGAPGGLSGSGAPNLQSMASQLLAGVYPTVKPLLESAIRKLTVTVSWREGSRDYNFNVVEYVTNPGQSMASGDTLNQIERMLGGGTMGSGQPGATPSSAPSGAGATSPPTPQGTTR
jgi:general secretion pathway protein I